MTRSDLVEDTHRGRIKQITARSTKTNGQTTESRPGKLTSPAIADDDELEAGVVDGPLVRQRLQHRKQPRSDPDPDPPAAESYGGEPTHHGNEKGRGGDGWRSVRRSSKTLVFELELGEAVEAEEGVYIGRTAAAVY
jgi:hypothetical protein